VEQWVSKTDKPYIYKVSIICTFVLVGLTIFEVQQYMNTGSQAELVIDMSHRDDFVNVNLDITFFRMPCDILSLDVQDILGTHKTDVMGDLNKKRLTKTGLVISTESALEKNEWRGSISDRVKKELDEEQGCRLTGFLKVYRVPGNMHIATHAYADIVNTMRSQHNKTFDFSYKIHHLSFGNKEDFDYI